MINTKGFGIKQTWDLELSSTLLPMQPNLGGGGGGVGGVGCGVTCLLERAGRMVGPVPRGG